jgi:glycosyltransferase involved in cell wall biosynthesis
MTRLLLYSDRSGVYGAERINQQLALAFQYAGFRVAVAQPPGDNPLTQALERAGIIRYDLPVENPYDWQNPAESLINPRVAEACFAATAPDLVFFGDGFPFASLAAKHAAIRATIPFLSLVHMVQPAWEREFAPFLPALAAANAVARQVVAVSAKNLKLVHDHFGLPASKGMVIHNGRPEEFFRPRDAAARHRLRQEWGIAEDDVVAITIGRFDHEKGYDLLLDAMPVLRSAPCWSKLKLVWVGNGPLLPRALQLARLVAGDRVLLLGERHDIADLLDAADLLVHPSRCEGLPLAVLEAMAKSLPVIATSVGGIPEALDGKGILLPDPACDPGFKRTLAEAIASLVGDETQRRTLGLLAHQRAEKCFTESHMVATWIDLIRSILRHA